MGKSKKKSVPSVSKTVVEEASIAAAAAAAAATGEEEEEVPETAQAEETGSGEADSAASEGVAEVPPATEEPAATVAKETPVATEEAAQPAVAEEPAASETVAPVEEQPLAEDEEEVEEVGPDGVIIKIRRKKVVNAVIADESEPVEAWEQKAQKEQEEEVAERKKSEEEVQAVRETLGFSRSEEVSEDAPVAEVWEMKAEKYQEEQAVLREEAKKEVETVLQTLGVSEEEALKVEEVEAWESKVEDRPPVVAVTLEDKEVAGVVAPPEEEVEVYTGQIEITPVEEVLAAAAAVASGNVSTLPISPEEVAVTVETVVAPEVPSNTEATAAVATEDSAAADVVTEVAAAESAPESSESAPIAPAAEESTETAPAAAPAPAAEPPAKRSIFSYFFGSSRK